MSNDAKPLHLHTEGLWTDDAPDVPASEWYARCTAGVLHDPESESVVCLCGLDAQERPNGLDADDGLPVGHLPRVEGPPVFAAWGVHPAVPSEQTVEQVDGFGLDLANHDALGVDGDAGVAPDPHAVGAPADADAAVRVDNTGEIGEFERVHNVPLSDGGGVTPFYSDEWLTAYLGDCREVMAAMPAESVHCVVSSPPYWGLRDYGEAGQLGLEPTLDEYVANLVAVFRAVRRVLRKDGTVWLNLGDAYATGAGRVGSEPGGGARGAAWKGPMTQPNRMPLPGLKPKDRVMIPARVALALQADGWWLRDEIVWYKSNPMPSSVTDRTTPAHEMVYLLTRSARYWYDGEAIRERAESGPSDLRKMAEGRERLGGLVKASIDPLMAASGLTNIGRKRSVGGAPLDKQASMAAAAAGGSSGTRTYAGFNGRWDAAEASGTAPAGRNKRSVWTIATQPYPGAHFAAFPEKLVEPMILAGCPEGGTVLDPFGGSGTVALVANRLGRKAVYIDLSADYSAQAVRRIAAARGAGDGPAIDMPVPFAGDGLWAESVEAVS